MVGLKERSILTNFFFLFPTILLFISVLNIFDFNYLGLKYFSFNFSYILIFFYSLKRSESLGYILIFIAGLFNDAVIGTPIGISSLLYLIICGSAAYIRNITLTPNFFKDWVFFLITILIINALSFMVLTIIFSYEVSYLDQLVNIFFTFLLYLFFSYIFNIFENSLAGRSNV